MRKVLALAAVLLAVAAAPTAQAQQETITVNSHESASIGIDLLADAPDILLFQLQESRYLGSSPLQAVVLRLSTPGEPVLDLAMVNNGGTWQAAMFVATPDLVAGTWTAQFRGLREGSASDLASRTLLVSATDASPPQLGIASPLQQAGKPIVVGPGDKVDLSIRESLLRSVTFTYGGLPSPLPMRFPFSLGESALPEGETSVTFQARDRVGQSGSLTVTILRDTVLPNLTVEVPSALYAGVPFDAKAIVTDATGYTVRLGLNGTTEQEQVAAGTTAKATVFNITAPTVGRMPLTVDVTDLAGNRASFAREVNVTKPVTDVKVSTLRLASPATNTSREGQTLVATVEQVGGVTALPVTVTFDGGGETQSFVVTVPKAGPVDVTWTTHLPGGQRSVTATAAAPASANETAPGNEQANLAVDSFIGRITAGNDVYALRADERGLPVQAVKAGTSTTYPLYLVDNAGRVAYRFTADGRDFDWDPLRPIQTLEGPSTSPSTMDSDEDSKDSPFPGLSMALAVVALALVARRRL